MYDYEDILRLKLPKNLREEFKDLLVSKYKFIAGQRQSIDGMLRSLSELSYRDRPEYLLADNVRDRAVAAFLGPASAFKQDILKLWLSVADKMTKFEKVMAGWDKV